MADVPLLNVQVLEGKVETTSGTEETSGFSAWPVFTSDPIVRPNVEMTDTPTVSGSLDPDEQVSGLSTYTFPVSCYFDGRTPTNTAPLWMTLGLPICGLKQTTRGAGVAPTAPTTTEIATASGAGGLNGTYTYKITTWNLSTRVETQPSTASSPAVTPDTTEGVRVTFGNAGAGSATIIYRIKHGGSIYYRVGIVHGTGAGGNLTFDDELADTAVDSFSPAPTSTAIDIWTPISASVSSATLRGFLDGHIRRNGIGCRGTASVAGSAGRRIDISFLISGKFGTDSLAPTMPQAPTFFGNGARLQSSAITIVPRLGSTSATGGSNGIGAAIENICVSDLSFDLGTQIDAHTCANSADGIAEYSLQDGYQATYAITLDGWKGASQWDPVADMRSGGGSCRFGSSFVVGSGAGQLKVIFPNLQIISAQPVRKDRGYGGYAIVFRPLAFIGNDWIRIERYTS